MVNGDETLRLMGAQMEVRGIHHIGILVRDAQVAATHMAQALGFAVSRWEEYGPGLLRIGFIPVGSILIELIEPLTSEGFNAEWLRTRGEGIQHIAFEVEDIRKAISDLRSQGIPLQDEEPRPGAANTLITFLPEALTAGILIELTQPLGGATSPHEARMPREA
jgi:methylmalonyl-CoA/ethylmalonyl-CoA epimerase